MYAAVYLIEGPVQICSVLNPFEVAHGTPSCVCQYVRENRNPFLFEDRVTAERDGTVGDHIVLDDTADRGRAADCRSRAADCLEISNGLLVLSHAGNMQPLGRVDPSPSSPPT